MSHKQGEESRESVCSSPAQRLSNVRATFSAIAPVMVKRSQGKEFGPVTGAKAVQGIPSKLMKRQHLNQEGKSI